MLKHSEKCHDIIAAPSKQPSEKAGTRGGGEKGYKIVAKSKHVHCTLLSILYARKVCKISQEMKINF